jgi:catechol 2,3-dioxygenase
MFSDAGGRPFGIGGRPPITPAPGPPVQKQGSWRDVAHIGHAELLTPDLAASLEYFTGLLGLTVASDDRGSVYLRGYGDYEPYCLKLTAAERPGLGHLAVRAWSPEALARRVAWLRWAGVPGRWVDPDGGKGPAFEFRDPDGHLVRIYYETTKYAPPAGLRPAMKSNHQRYAGRGANVRRLEHVNLMARDVRACREFWSDGFGLRTFEIIRRDDGSEDGAWLSATVQATRSSTCETTLAPPPGCTTSRSGSTQGRTCCARPT